MVSKLDELSPDQRKATYEAPELRCLGDLRERTLGGSGCYEDSTAGTKQPHPIFCP